jgi:hypothetical protein
MVSVPLLALLLACAGSADKAPEETGDAPAPVATADVSFTDAHNYTYVGDLDAPAFPVAQLSDAVLSWSGLSKDLRCHDLDPVADIDNTALLIFPHLTEAEVEEGLSNDSLDQADLGAYLSYEPGDATSASLSQFTFFGTDADIELQFEEGSGTWLVLLTTGTQVAVGARMLAVLEPRADTTVTTADADDGCAVLDFSADLGSLDRLPVLAEGPWRLDWSALTRDGHGNPFVSTRVDGVMVARYDESPSELEDRFLDLELIAEETWSWPIESGTSADIEVLAGDTPFPGFTGPGTWALALTCGTCPNPAPIFLTILDPQ